MSINTENLEACISAVLAVNLYGLEKAYGLLPEFRQAGLTDPIKVTERDLSTIIKTMKDAGYNRGLLSEMMAGRLISLMAAVVDGKLNALDTLVASGDRQGVVNLLCQVKGIGPKVAQDVWMLVRSERVQPEDLKGK